MKRDVRRQAPTYKIIYGFSFLVSFFLFLELALTPSFKQSVVHIKLIGWIVLTVLLATCFLSMLQTRRQSTSRGAVGRQVGESAAIKFFVAFTSLLFFFAFLKDLRPAGILVLSALGAACIVSVTLMTRCPGAYKRVFSFLERNKIARALQFVAIQCLVILLLAEACFRILSPAIPEIRSGFIADEKLGFRQRPGYMHRGRRLNSGGFFDDEFTSNKLPNEFRIVALGDSFAAGWVPYEENFLTILESDLQKRIRFVQTTVLNMGIPSYGLADEVRLLEAEGLQLKPDAIIVAFYIGNDLTDNIKGERRTLRAGHVVSIPPSGPVGKLMMNKNWAVYNYAKAIDVAKRVKAAKKSELAWSETYPDEAQASQRSTFSNKLYNKILYRKREIFLKQRPRYIWERVKFVEELLLNLKNDLELRGIPWVLVLIPGEVQVDKSVREALVEAYDLKSDEYDFERPQREMVEFCTAHGIEVLDLLPVFGRDSQRERLYLFRDTHWNKAGNALAAREIRDYITEHWLEQLSSASSYP